MRAWTKLASFAGRSSFRAWLYKIATNTGLNMLAHASRRAPTMNPAPPAQASAPGEPVWFEPLLDSQIADLSATPDAVYSLRESVSLAFMVALQGLPPHQRVTLILRDVLDWRATEVAEFLDLSVPAVNSALQRARTTLADATTQLASKPSRRLRSLHRCKRCSTAIYRPGKPTMWRRSSRCSRKTPRSPCRRNLNGIAGETTLDDSSRQVSLLREPANGAWPRCLRTLNRRARCIASTRLRAHIPTLALMILTLDGPAIASSIAFVDPALGAR